MAEAWQYFFHQARGFYKEPFLHFGKNIVTFLCFLDGQFRIVIAARGSKAHFFLAIHGTNLLKQNLSGSAQNDYHENVVAPASSLLTGCLRYIFIMPRLSKRA